MMRGGREGEESNEEKKGTVRNWILRRREAARTRSKYLKVERKERE
jgi:hypothetical protein